MASKEDNGCFDLASDDDDVWDVSSAGQLYTSLMMATSLLTESRRQSKLKACGDTRGA